jgi:hypothetical protein
MHCGVLVVVDDFVVTGPDAAGGCCGDAHDAAPTHPTAMTVIHRIAFDIDADLSAGWFAAGRYWVLLSI